MDKRKIPIEIKDTSILIGLMLHRFDPKLIPIVKHVSNNYGLVMTESWRPARYSGDLHSTNPVRAIDLRSWCYEDGVAERIRDEINIRWIYDPNRPEMKCATIHAVKGGAVHFHIQVHPNTKAV